MMPLGPLIFSYSLYANYKIIHIRDIPNLNKNNVLTRYYPVDKR